MLNTTFSSGKNEFHVKPSPIEGYGLFAGNHIPFGTLIPLSFAKTVGNKEAYEMKDDQDNNLFPVPGNRWAFHDGMFVFINHSEDPNMEYQKSDSPAFVAIKDIAPGTELTTDYRLLLVDDQDNQFTDLMTGKLVRGVNEPYKPDALDSSKFTLKDVFSQVSKSLKTIKSELPFPFTIDMVVSEFTSMCPITGYADYASIRIGLLVKPGNSLPEQKSFRDWLTSFRDVDAYQEEITGAIKEVIHSTCGIAYEDIVVEATWNGRGGITNTVTV